MISAAMCLAMAIYFEARSEPLEGQYAVAEVIVNRVESPRFPPTVCAVIKQDKGPKDHDCQFSFFCDGKPEVITEPKAFDKAKMIARDVLFVEGTPDYVGDALYYHTTGVSPRWSRKLAVAGKYGKHIFFSEDVS